MEQNSKVVLVFHLDLVSLGKERDLPNFAEKVSKLSTLGTVLQYPFNQAVGGLLLLCTVWVLIDF